MNAADQLTRIEALLASDRANLTEAAAGMSTADLVEVALQAREDAARQGWRLAGLAERQAAEDRATWAAHLAAAEGGR